MASTLYIILVSLMVLPVGYWIVNRGLKTTKIRKIVPQIEVYKTKRLVGKRYIA